MGDLWRRVGWNRLLVTAGCLVAWRALETVQFAAVGPRLFVLQPRSYSVVALGVRPYVGALIVMTLARFISRRLGAMGSDDDGRRLLMRWTRAITAVVTLGQAYAFAALIQAAAIVAPLDWFSSLVVVLQLTAGTMTLVFLGELVDEAGLGFGNGVLWIYALGAVATQDQRFHDFTIAASAYGDLSPYRPLAIWIGASIVLVLASVAVLRAYRAIALVEGRHARSARPLALPLVMSGVLRPPVFAATVLSVPPIYSSYVAASQPGVHAWIEQNWSAYGTNAGWDLLYVAIAVGLVIVFACLAAEVDFDPVLTASRLKQRRLLVQGRPGDRDIAAFLRTRFRRLTFAGAGVLALATVVVPTLVYLATRALGAPLPLSGTDVLLVTAMVLAAAATIEGAGAPEARGDLSPVPGVI